MSRTPSTRTLLAASAAVTLAVALFACGNGTFQNELPVYDADVGEIDAASLLPNDDSATPTDGNGSTLDANDGATPHDGGHDGSDGASPHEDGGDASSDGHADVE